MKTNRTTTLDAQEDEYWFPYHYIAQMPTEGFRQHFVDTWGINYISTINFLLKRITNINPNSLIDIGCGDGRLTREIALNSNVSTLYGIDYSQRAINLASAMNANLPQVKFMAADITSNHEIPKSDVIILMEVFEHIPIESCKIFIESISKMLKPRGRLLITVPHKNKPLENKHFQHFSIKSLTEYIADYFNIIEVIPFEKIGLLRKVLNLVLSNRLFVLSNGFILRKCYLFHQRYLFKCRSETECQRLFVEAEIK